MLSKEEENYRVILDAYSPRLCASVSPVFCGIVPPRQSQPMTLQNKVKLFQFFRVFCGASPFTASSKRYTPPHGVQMGYRVKEVQPTPNPNAHKFILDRPITQQPVSFFNAEAAMDDPVGKALFEIPGVTSLLFLGDFITVNKSPSTKWGEIRGKVESVLAKMG